MRNSSGALSVVVVEIDMGWAVVDESSWEYIDDQLTTAREMSRCRTWGDFRELGLDDEGLLELAFEQNGFEVGDWPDDDAPFRFSVADSEWFERNLWLGRATTDLLTCLPDDFELDEWFEVGDEISFVVAEKIDGLVDLLLAQGHAVHRLGASGDLIG